MLRLSQSQLNTDCPIQTEFLNKVNLDSTSLLDDNRPDMWTINSFLINVRAKQTAYGSQVPGLRMLLQIITIAYRACSWFNELQKIRCMEYFLQTVEADIQSHGFLSRTQSKQEDALFGDVSCGSVLVHVSQIVKFLQATSMMT